MSSNSSVQPAEALEVLAFARLCPLADGQADNQSIEYEVLRDADEDDEEEPEEVGWAWASVRGDPVELSPTGMLRFRTRCGRYLCIPGIW